MSREIDATLQFVALWPTGDADEMAERFAPDATYQDMPFDIVHRGRDAIRTYLANAFERMEIQWVVHHISQSGDWVLTERTDIVTVNDQQFEIPVMGAMEFATGLVRTWRDYYQFPPGLAEATRRRRADM